jgi:DNA-binding NarL/FixJ family response regulator
VPDESLPISRARVLVVSDVRLYREGLVYCLGRRESVEVIGCAASVDEALHIARRESAAPALVLVDVTMPHALQGARALMAEFVEIKIIALAVSDHERDIVACAEAGIVGYVDRDGSLDDLVAIIDTAARGELLCSTRIASALLRRLRSLAPDAAAASETLTAREQEIFELIALGCANKEIASRLCIGVATVKNHVHNILEKLHVRRRGQAVARARANEAYPIARRELDAD